MSSFLLPLSSHTEARKGLCDLNSDHSRYLVCCPDMTNMDGQVKDPQLRDLTHDLIDLDNMLPENHFPTNHLIKRDLSARYCILL
jgi:hypothetical protein